MFRLLVRLALRLLRFAGESFFCFELNRFLGRTVCGSIRHRAGALRHAEANLLRHVRAPIRTSYVQVPCGLRLYTIVAGCKDDKPDLSNPIVLLHGHSMGGATFFKNFDDFLEMGYSVVFALDLPGWARSSRPRYQCGRDQLDRNCSALDFFLTPFKQWLSSLGLSRFALMGHSLGAYLAHEYTLRAPPHTVTSLILEAPAAVSRRTPLAQAIWFSLTPQSFLTHGGLLAHLFFNSKYPRTPSYNVNGFKQFTLFANSIAHRSGDAAAAAILRFQRSGVLKWRSECILPLIERVGLLHCPVHLVAGDHDQLVPVEDIRLLYRAMVAKGNNAALSVITGADHSPHIFTPFTFAKSLMRRDASLTSSVSCRRQHVPMFEADECLLRNEKRAVGKTVERL